MGSNRFFILIGAVMAIGLVAVTRMDFYDALSQQTYNCDMIQMWEQDADQGIEPFQRRGWPARDDQQLQECKTQWLK